MSILTDIKTAVGALVSGRCYPLNAPEKPTAPYAVYFQVANAPEVTMETAIPIENTRVQVDVYAKTYAEAQTLAGATRTAMMGLGAVPLLHADLFEQEVKLYRVVQDFSIWFKR